MRHADPDGKDRHPDAVHLLGGRQWRARRYLRMLPPGLSFPEASFGRVVTAPSHRGHGLGDALVVEALDHMTRIWPSTDIRIGAQARLVGYYGKHGFEIASDEFLEDDIPHREMLRRAH